MELLQVRALRKVYAPHSARPVTAVAGATFSLRRGETLGLVGESGCGKTTLGRLLLMLERPTSGEIVFDGQNIAGYGFSRLRPLRRRMQMVFQGSWEAFDPFCTVAQALAEPLRSFGEGRGARERSAHMLERVGLPADLLDRYPRELSGGQRQRVNIARALILDPEFVVCDEITASVDYALRAQILDLVCRLRHENGLTCLFISHDAAAVERACGRVMVMYLGHVLEIARSLSSDAAHPYALALKAAALPADPHKRARGALFNEKGGMSVPERGCVYADRCLMAAPECRECAPVLRDAGGGHWIACHRV